jgi:hypothetical protein
MDETWFRAWTIIVAILQAIILALGLKQVYRVASWLAWLCPAILLSCWLLGAVSNSYWQMGKLDIIFLALDIPTLLLSVVLLLRKGAPPLFFWNLWILNLVLCFGAVGLAFFFKLHF